MPSGSESGPSSRELDRVRFWLRETGGERPGMPSICGCVFLGIRVGDTLGGEAWGGSGCKVAASVRTAGVEASSSRGEFISETNSGRKVLLRGRTKRSNEAL